MIEFEIDHGDQPYQYTVNPAGLTRFVIFMLWVLLCLDVLSAVSDYMQLNLLYSGSFSVFEAETNDSRQRLIAIIYIVSFVVTGVAFLRWIYRANKNCHGFGAEEMEFTPGWSIGYYFIPILNLFKPYLAMKEIWKVSTNPEHWQREKGNAILGWWWAFWLLSGFLGQLTFRFSTNAKTIDALQTSTIISMSSSIAGIPLCLIAISLVKNIQEKQAQLVKKII